MLTSLSVRKYCPDLFPSLATNTRDPKITIIIGLRNIHFRITWLTAGLAQQVPMQPMIEPDRVRMAEKALIIRIARKQLSMTLMSSQLCTVKEKKNGFHEQTISLYPTNYSRHPSLRIPSGEDLVSVIARVRNSGVREERKITTYEIIC